jgi:hypothetical protein
MVGGALEAHAHRQLVEAVEQEDNAALLEQIAERGPGCTR